MKSHITPNIDTKVEALNNLSQKLGGRKDAKNLVEAIENITTVAEPGASSIDDLDGVTISDPEDGDALVYDEASGNWVPGVIESGGITNIRIASYNRNIKPTTEVSAGNVGQILANWSGADHKADQIIAVYDYSYKGRFFEIVGRGSNILSLRVHIEPDGTPITANEQISISYTTIVTD